MKRREGVWLVEHRTPAGNWTPTAWGGDSGEDGAPHSRAWGRCAMRTARSQYPGEKYRLAFYVPATPKQPKPTVTRKVKRR